jgi:hypothetical protein
VLDGADLLDLGVRDVERVEDLGLGDLARAGLHHEDRVLGAGTMRSRSDSSRSCSSVGLMTKLPSTLPMRTAPTGRGQRTGESMSAAEAPFIARMSHGSSWSTDMGIVTSWVS